MLPWEASVAAIESRRRRDDADFEDDEEAFSFDDDFEDDEFDDEDDEFEDEEDVEEEGLDDDLGEEDLEEDEERPRRRR